MQQRVFRQFALQPIAMSRIGVPGGAMRSVERPFFAVHLITTVTLARRCAKLQEIRAQIVQCLRGTGGSASLGLAMNGAQVSE